MSIEIHETGFDLPEDHWSARATCPVYRRKGHGHPEHVGSAVLCRIERSYFLLTAAHVADFIKGGDVHVGIDDDLLPVTAAPVSTRLPGSSRLLDPLDVSIIRLDQQTLNRASEISVVEIGSMDRRTFSEESDYYVIQGFPTTKQGKRIRESTLDVYLYRAISVEHPAEVHSEFHLNLGFVQGEMYREEAQVTAPDPDGMSGSGVWLLHNGHSDMSLSGILIEHRRARKLLRATRTWFLLAAVWHSEPDLRPYIPEPIERG